MAKRIVTIPHQIEDVSVEQRKKDGYINATHLCKAHKEKTGERKDPSDWLRLKSAKSAMEKLSAVTGIPVTDLFDVRQGGKYQGTWIHPRLAVRFTMWLNTDFSLQVEDWVHSWFESDNNPSQIESDTDRVKMRDSLKDRKRLEFTDQIKAFLESVGEYVPNSFSTRKVFWTAHDNLNCLLTTETAKQMRKRLEAEIGKDVTEKELLRDYFPIDSLADYAAMCQAAANEMAMNGTDPFQALEVAAKQVLPRDYVAKPIDFTERISLVRQRLEGKNQVLISGV